MKKFVFKPRDEKGRFLATQVVIEDGLEKLEKHIEKGKITSFRHAAGAIYKAARESIKSHAEPSEPGRPPHTRKKQRLKKGLRYAADKYGAVIGPMASYVGQAGAAHEFGEEYKGDEFEERPFMRPALKANLDRFAESFLSML